MVASVEELSEKQHAALDRVQAQLANAQQVLLQEHPEIQGYMQAIHSDLRQYPELKYLLDDVQIGTLYQGMMVGTEVVIRKKTARKAGKKSDNILADGRSIGDLL